MKESLYKVENNIYTVGIVSMPKTELFSERLPCAKAEPQISPVYQKLLMLAFLLGQFQPLAAV